MDTPEQPPDTKPFWTRDIFALVGLNIVFLGVILWGIFALFGAFMPVLAAWIQKNFGL